MPGAAYDERKLKELEERRREILAVKRENERLLREFEAGRRTMSRGKRMAIVQSLNDAKHSLPELTKEIMEVKRRIARREQKEKS